MKSRSAFDFSVDYSNTVSVLTAIGPDQPDAPTTVVDETYENVIISWVAPEANNLPILSY